MSLPSVAPASLAPDPRGFEVDFTNGQPLSEADSARLAQETRHTFRISVAPDLDMRHSPAMARLVDDWEADQWLEHGLLARMRASQMRLSCSNSTNRAFAAAGERALSGVGFWANNHIVEDLCRQPDPRPLWPTVVPSTATGP